MALSPMAMQPDALGQETVLRPVLGGLVSRQVLPFHLRALPSTTVPEWSAKVPTAMQLCALGQETCDSTQKNGTHPSPDMFIRRQARPFHASATLDVVFEGMATQNEAVAHETAAR
jgi:hypothetical protein